MNSAAKQRRTFIKRHSLHVTGESMRALSGLALFVCGCQLFVAKIDSFAQRAIFVTRGQDSRLCGPARRKIPTGTTPACRLRSMFPTQMKALVTDTGTVGCSSGIHFRRRAINQSTMFWAT